MDHAARMSRARLALEGISVGDAFGGRFFLPPDGSRRLPPAPWRYSDDTVMAMAVVNVLDRSGEIESEELAVEFARRYMSDPHRGYGLSVRGVLEAIAAGQPFAEAAGTVHGGQGSKGNGAAMRVAPLRAYFADDLPKVASQADASARTTHAHTEGRAGAIAVAIAAAWASRRPGLGSGGEMLDVVVRWTPAGETRSGIERASDLDFTEPIEVAIGRLGNGSRITAPDTVPFALWCAGRHIDDYAEALWSAAEAGGDNDTNGAIVGGIVALANGAGSIPGAWLSAREPLDAPGLR